jgi:hypothetical protein
MNEKGKINTRRSTQVLQIHVLNRLNSSHGNIEEPSCYTGRQLVPPNVDIWKRQALRFADSHSIRQYNAGEFPRGANTLV